MARSEIPMVNNLRQNKIADYQMCVQSVLSLPLQSEHCKVVALFHVAYKVGYSLRHPFDERAGVLGGGLHHLIDPFLTKHPATGILSLVESVGIEEYGAARSEVDLLCRIFPVGYGTYGQIGIHGKRLSVDNRCFMSGITVSQVPCVEIEHASEEGDKHRHAVFADHHIVHVADDTHWLRLTL